VKFAEDHRMTMSMTEQYDPYENAVAERVNRTLKYEFGLKMTIKNFALAKKMVAHGVHIYNTRRLHWSLNLLTPKQVHASSNLDYKIYRKDKSSVEKLLH
jgi:transposase InsO family protein